MENNTEEKAFKAQYWGQNVLHQNIQGHEITPFDEGYAVNERTISWKGTYLLLNSLESITEEHAIEVAKIFDIDEQVMIETNLPEWVNALFVESAGYYIDGYTGTQLLNAIDFLRKHSYALPYDGKPVSELISRGWVKIKQQ